MEQTTDKKIIENCKQLIFCSCEESHKYGLDLNNSLKLDLLKDWNEICKLSKKSVWQILTSSLDLRGTNISTLPDNLSVGDYLDLRGTNRTTLPDNLSVGGYLDLEGTNITTLPDNLSVGGSLDLRGTNITTLPDNLSVGGYIIK